jgi:hypothetical protein
MRRSRLARKKLQIGKRWLLTPDSDPFLSEMSSRNPPFPHSVTPELLQLLNFSETARSARVASFFSNLHAPCPWGAPDSRQRFRHRAHLDLNNSRARRLCTG